VSDNRDDRIESYYQESARFLAECVVDLEDEKHKILTIVSDWCIEANEVGGVDAGDLAFRLEEAGFSLPSED
jgi:hypothetical protein